MNKLLLSFVIVLIVLAAAGDALLTDAGYILIKFQQTAIETSLLVFGLMVLVGALILVGVIKLLARIFGIKSYWQRWLGNRNRKRAQQKINEGMLSLLKEDWSSAKSTLQAAAKHQEFALVGLLALADAGQRTGDFKTRDNSFDKLEKQLGNDATLALGLARADHYQKSSQWSEARVTLERLRKIHPKHAGVIRRLLENYSAQNAWSSLEGLLQAAKKHKVLDSELLTTFENKSFIGNFIAAIESAHNRSTLARANPKSDRAASSIAEIESELTHNLIAMWSQAPEAQKQNAQATLKIVDSLTSNNFEETAKSLLEKALKHEVSPELIKRYGQLNCHQPERLITFLEKGIGKAPQNAEYLFALGRLYARAGDMATAHPLLEKSVQQKQTRWAYRCLADIYDQLQQHERSSQCYRKALAL